MSARNSLNLRRWFRRDVTGW